MAEKGEFADGLYHGAAGYYDRYRLPYPDAMISGLVHRAVPPRPGPTHPARLLDLACGTGQLAFPLLPWFDEAWCVDAEPDMTALVRGKARTADVPVRVVTARAEELDVGPVRFDLVVIGNAFHRLDRGRVARLVSGWLEPGGRVALCWSDSPWAGPAAWQRALRRLLRRWQDALDSRAALDNRGLDNPARDNATLDSRVPDAWEQDRQREPDRDVLARAGLRPEGRHEFSALHRWTVPELAGFIRSTSFLPPPVLAGRGAEFDDDLAAELGRHTVRGRLVQTVGFACETAMCVRRRT